MFRLSARNSRSAKHTHEYRVHNVGADLQRQVCSSCGQVSISSAPRPSLRSIVTDANPRLSHNDDFTIVIDETAQPVGLSWRFGERRTRR